MLLNKQRFGSFSDFKINNKTEIIPKLVTKQEEDDVKTITGL